MIPADAENNRSDCTRGRQALSSSSGSCTTPAARANASGNSAIHASAGHDQSPEAQEQERHTGRDAPTVLDADGDVVFASESAPPDAAAATAEAGNALSNPTHDREAILRPSDERDPATSDEICTPLRDNNKVFGVTGSSSSVVSTARTPADLHRSVDDQSHHPQQYSSTTSHAVSQSGLRLQTPGASSASETQPQHLGQGRLGLLVAAAEVVTAQSSDQHGSTSLRASNSPPLCNDPPGTASRVSIDALTTPTQGTPPSAAGQGGLGVASLTGLPIGLTDSASTSTLTATKRSVSSPQVPLKSAGISNTNGVGRHRSRPQPIQALSASSRRAAPYPLQSASLNSAATSAFRTPVWLHAMATSTASSSSSAPATPPPPMPQSARFSPQITSPRMSMSHKRTPPAWPSPRFDRHAGPAAAAPAHTPDLGSSTSPTPRSSYLSSPPPPLLPLATPAALRVPPTPQYSPAFHRSGYEGPSAPGSSSSSTGPIREPLASASAPSFLLGRPLVQTPRTAGGSRVSLAGVPQGYIIRQLNALAPKFWNSPETTDCSIVVPVPRKQRGGTPPSAIAPPDSAPSAHTSSRSHWPPTPLGAGLPTPNASGDGTADVVTAGQTQRGRRGSLPADGNVPVLIFPLHKDYLITQSTLFRSLLAPAPHSHLDIAMREAQQPPTSASAASRSSEGQASARAPPASARAAGPSRPLRGARVLPTKTGEPTAVYVPLPDPGSFGVIVHWLYWGDITALETALNKGMVTWQGVVKNIEYLALDDSVKRVMGKWWRRWVKTDVGRQRTAAAAAVTTTSATRLGGVAEDANGVDEDRPGKMDKASRRTAGRQRRHARNRQGWNSDMSDSDGGGDDADEEDDEAMDIEGRPFAETADDQGVSGLLQAL